MQSRNKPTSTTIEISKEYLHFAAAHFTLFSSTSRENLHGHNFHVNADISAAIGTDGLTFDYNILKKALKNLCDQLDEQVLMPAHSPYLEIEPGEEHTIVHFNGERIPFLERDLTVLPVRNITVEELAHYFLQQLRDTPEVAALDINEITLKCSSGEGQWATAHWLADTQDTY